MRLLGGGTFRQPLWSLPGLTTLDSGSRPAFGSVSCSSRAWCFFRLRFLRAANYSAQSNRQNARAFTVLMLGLFASIVLIFIAGDAVLFLLAWEVMSILS